MKINKNQILCLLLIVFNIIKLDAQSIGISASPSTPDASSILDVKSTTKGMLIPRMTTTEKKCHPFKSQWPYGI
jgi:hypothetical protein